MTTTETTYHEIEPYAITVDGVEWASARCRTHMTATRERWPQFGQAARGFVCDEGKNLCFVTEFRGEDIDVTPVMRDLTGLARTIRSEAESAAYGQVYGETRIWQWHPGGRTEPLTIKPAGSTPFDDDDWATATWHVTGEDGRVITEISVRIDGRA